MTFKAYADLELDCKMSDDVIARLEQQLAAAELKAGEYEKALELAQTMLIEATNTSPPSDVRWTIIADALAAHRKGGEGG